MCRAPSTSSLLLLATLDGASSSCATQDDAEPTPLLSSTAQLLRVERAVPGESVVVLPRHAERAHRRDAWSSEPSALRGAVNRHTSH